MSILDKNDPALTYTLSDFVERGKQDELTYENFSILQYRMPTEFAEDNILNYYLEELKKLCNDYTFTSDDVAKYKYAPDLLAFDLYGSTQLDFIILLCNGIVDPKEFDFSRKYVKLPNKEYLKEFLSQVYNAETDWMNLNRTELEEQKRS